MRLLIIQLLFSTVCIGQSGYEVSTYDDPESAKIIEDHQKTLRRLDSSNVFSAIHKKLLPSLPIHKSFFSGRPNLKLLYSADGDILHNKAVDGVFVIYDKTHTRVSIIIYNALTKSYRELYRDIKIENGLARAQCSYGGSGTLDYQLGDNLVYQYEYLIKAPLKLLENTICKIVRIAMDKDFVLEEGCFMNKDTKTAFLNVNSLCITTSTVYNNWECLMYDKTKNTFVIFYGQAFAD